MGWKDKLRKASFRDVSFGVQGDSQKGGRRTAIHEFPGKNDPMIEDLGGKSQPITLEAFVIGEDYFTDRDALINALCESGPGKLIHPYYGEILIQVLDWEVRHGVEIGGMASFTITFSRTKNATYPQVSQNNKSLLETKSDELDSKTSSFAEKKINVGNGNNLIHAGQIVTDCMDKIREEINGIAKKMNVLDSFTKEINDIVVSAYMLIRTPLNLVYKVQNVFKSLVGSGSIAVSSINSYLKLYDNLTEYFDGYYYNSVEQQKRQNANTLKLCFLSCVLGATVKTASQIDYETYKQANDTKDSIAEKINALLYQVDDDDIYQSIVEIKILLFKTVPPPGVLLKNISRIELQESVPAIILSYRLYGDLDHETEIIKRNSIRHPGVLKKEIEVIL